MRVAVEAGQGEMHGLREQHSNCVSSMFAVPPQVDEIECIIPAYEGLGFEVSVCIMKAERIRIVMQIGRAHV